MRRWKFQLFQFKYIRMYNFIRLSTSIFFRFIFVILVGCSGPQILIKDPLYNKKINYSKRLVVFSSSENQLTKMENLALMELSRDLINDHKEFIVYRNPAKFSGNCGREYPKVEGIFLIHIKQTELSNNLNLDVTASLIQCPDSREIWKARKIRSFKLNSLENESLRNTYIQKFGMGIGSRVNPYYKIISEILSTLESPTLSGEEVDEKIDIGST